jgi:hypothetical protein
MGLNFFTGTPAVAGTPAHPLMLRTRCAVRAGFDLGYEVVMIKRRIVLNYLGGWFLIDITATVDWEAVLSSFFEPEHLPGWVSMMALLKILRLARAGRLIDTLSSRWSTHSGFVEAGKFLLYVIVVAHLLACFFFMWPILVDEHKWGIGSPECAKDEDAAAAARSCIESGGVDADAESGECDMYSAVGWYYKSSCMQGSWREQQGLEQICLPNVCGDQIAPGKWNWAMDTSWWLSRDFLTTCDDGSPSRPLTVDEAQETLLMCMHTADQDLHTTDPDFRICPKCNRPFRLYLDAMYWSLTTMTTIGYGDRGPKTETEILYTLFAEVFGLAFFALLLTQINSVNELLGLASHQPKATKDGIMQFLASRRVDTHLVAEVVRFLSFRNKSFSGKSITDVPEMDALSDGVRANIRSAVYVPVLKKLSMFGWNQDDEVELENVKQFFERIDESGDGRLDREEIGHLFASLGISLPEDQFNICYAELDREDNGSVDFSEFAWWWFKTKYGVPRAASGVKCPELFLSELAEKLRPKMFGPGDRLIKPGEYGHEFVILLGGKLRILRPGVRPGLPGSHPDDANRVDKRDRFILPDDRAPVFGFSSCLTKLQHELVRNRTDYWAIDAEVYSDTLWCPRKHFYECFSKHWLKGRDDMVEMAYYHYEVESILNSQTMLDGDGDGVVSHEEFLEASAQIPHGFAARFAAEKKAVIKEAQEKGHTVKGTLDTGSLGHQEQVEADNNATFESLLGREELMMLRVKKLDEVATRLADDVGTIKQGMRALLDHHNEGWIETESKDTKSESSACTLARTHTHTQPQCLPSSRTSEHLCVDLLC